MFSLHLHMWVGDSPRTYAQNDAIVAARYPYVSDEATEAVYRRMWS